jgi:hypothetical protein
MPAHYRIQIDRIDRDAPVTIFPPLLAHVCFNEPGQFEVIESSLQRLAGSDELHPDAVQALRSLALFELIASKASSMLPKIDPSLSS